MRVISFSSNIPFLVLNTFTMFQAEKRNIQETDSWGEDVFILTTLKEHPISSEASKKSKGFPDLNFTMSYQSKAVGNFKIFRKKDKKAS